MSGPAPAAFPALEPLGWDGPFDALFAEHARQGLEPGRVTADLRDVSIVRVGGGEVHGTVSGRFRHAVLGPGDFPAVGDWVALEARLDEGSGTIHAVLPRRSAITRTASDSNRTSGGRLADEQVLAANVDLALLVAAIDREPNLRRLERYLALAWGSGATPVVVLNKADRSVDVGAALTAVEAIAIGVDVHAISALTGDGLDRLETHLRPGRTAVVLGPSGVGKTTLANALLGGGALATRAVRESDGRGRHATTHRELLPLPNGALLVDTPGIRSLELLEGDDGVEAAYADVEALAAACRFTDCHHGGEPGCAVDAALADGRLDPGRLAGYRKLRRETTRSERERDPRARQAERRRWRILQAEVGRHMRAKYGPEYR